jgi:predicted molibdopterin-dependent oxidoreductase YjgC
MISRDLNKCILCGRCIRACNEIQVNEILDFSERGSRAKVGPAFDEDYINSNCYFCGECVDACPWALSPSNRPVSRAGLGTAKDQNDLYVLRRRLSVGPAHP